MESQLYIPKKIKVGFQEREDTYSKKLAYVTYFDDKNVLRKETSWQNWRDKKIEPEEFDNTPQDGFVLNKNVERYKWSHFGTNRSYIRIYDPRGIEFEVTPENLIGILMNANCCKRGLDGKFVYAWHHKDLVLLPANCEEYEKAVSFTSLQGQKIGAKDLVPGCSYKTKRQEDLIYVGRYDWYNFCLYTNGSSRKGKKYYIFTSDGKDFQTKSGLDFLAAKNSDEIVSNYSDIIENFQKNPRSNKIVNWEVKPCEINTQTTKREYYEERLVLKESSYFKIDNGVLIQYNVDLNEKYVPSGSVHYTYEGYRLEEYYRLNVENQSVIMKDKNYCYNSFLNRYDKVYSLESLNNLGLGNLYITYENGKKQKLENLYKL